uniref:Sodium/calcium exchanger membrane region domain-containing protein n=1 Tax=Panagrolaimus superbus TaxID=310955 RepID=A0A914ZFY0_9BILA
MTTTADDFFCLSISTIVDHLKISQSLAGITLMAFGNGAPDIFSTIASVLNTKRPKAGLAIGDLLGGGAFVTTIVFSTVIITKPFKAAKWATLRDLSFYLIGIAWMAFIMMYDSRLMERAMSNFSQISELKADALSMNSSGAVLQLPKQSVSTHDSYPHIDDSENADDDDDPENNQRSRRHTIASHFIDSTSKFNSPINIIMEPMDLNVVANNSQASNFMIPSIVISPSNPLDGNETEFKYYNGKFHYSEKEFDSESDDASDIIVVPATHTGRRFTILSLNEAKMSMQTDMPSVSPDEPITVMRIFKDLITALNPIEDDFGESKWYSKILQAMKFPLIVVLRLTVPQAIVWCKTLSLIHCLTMPITVLFSFSLLTINVIDADPGLWIYSFIPSIVMFLLVLFFTSYNIEPSYHKNISGYFGFLISVSWIYLISSEVVNVISMISVISRISHEILGLTVMAWCNSIGDLVADISVAKQGFPQMAASAAIGGPLFNLLVGFGAAFFIATLQGKHVDTICKFVFDLQDYGYK